MLLWPLLSREMSELCVINIAPSIVIKTKQRVKRSAERGEGLVGQLRCYLLTAVTATGNIILRLGKKIKATLQEAAPQEGRSLSLPWSITSHPVLLSAFPWLHQQDVSI